MTLKYDNVVNRLYTVIGEGYEDTVRDLSLDLKTQVSKVQRRFFKRLALKMIDKKRAPNLGQFTPVWKKLEYQTKKTNEGYTGGFFKKTGDLRKDLIKESATTVLGTPLIVFGVTKGRGGTQARDSLGRFAKVTPNVKQLSSTIFIDPYPKIVENIDKDIVNESKYFKPEISSKLKNVNGAYRPLFQPYLRWFLDTEVRAVVQKAISK